MVSEKERVEGRESGLQRSLVDTTHLVRSIQRAEGNPDCFRKAEGDCDRVDCSWRRYCLPGGIPRLDQEGPP